MTYQDLEYDNGTTVDEDDEVLPGKDGYTIKLHLEKDLGSIQSVPIALFAGVRYDDYDSDDALYEYDRVQVFTGIEASFGS